MTVINVDSAKWEEVVDGEKVIVDFYADWCGPCKMMAPIFEELSEEYEDLKFVKLDTQNNQELSQKYGIQGIPALLVLEDGEEVDRIVGFNSKEALKNKIDSILEDID
ncbi:MAG: thioredoxin [Nanoarchaeota archaeon]